MKPPTGDTRTVSRAANQAWSPIWAGIQALFSECPEDAAFLEGMYLSGALYFDNNDTDECGNEGCAHWVGTEYVYITVHYSLTTGDASYLAALLRHEAGHARWQLADYANLTMNRNANDSSCS